MSWCGKSNNITEENNFPTNYWKYAISFVHTIHVAYSLSVLWSSYECVELVDMREPLYDRCLTLEIQRDPWLNGIRTNQCNHAGVWGKRGQRGHSLSACLLELLARFEHQVCFCFCMEWQTADWPHECYIALRSPQMPHKKSLGRSASRTWPWWMWWIPQLACWGGYSTTGFMCAVSSPSKAPCHCLLGQTCPAGPTWKSTPSACPIWKSHPLSSLFLPALIQHNSFFLSLPHSHSICQSYQPVNGFWSDPFVCEYQFINQSVHTLIAWG